MRLHTLDPNLKYWVVRPGSNGRYFEHFRSNNVMCLGHMDQVPVLGEGIISKDDIEYIDIEIKKIENAKPNDKRESSSQITKKVSQIKTFISEMSVGDIVFTLDSDRVLIGTIKSEPFVEDTPIIAHDKKGHPSSLYYKLRRDVEWEHPKPRQDIPFMVRSSLVANPTVFSLESHKLMLNHWLFSLFRQDDKIYFSTQLGSEHGISQFHVTEFQRIIQKLELITDKIDNKEINCQTVFDDEFFSKIESLYIEKGLKSEFTLTTKNVFMSPGNIWSEMIASEAKAAIFTALLSASFGLSAETVNDDNLSPEINDVIKNITVNLNSKSHFESLRSKIDANLDKPNKGIPAIRITEEPQRGKIIFPEDNKEGVTGI